MPNFEIEKKLNNEGFSIIAGIDEAGRGSWAGPVVAGAVIFTDMVPPCDLLKKIDDSKKLTSTIRDSLSQTLCSDPNIFIGIGFASVREIEKLNIVGATMVAMKRAAMCLGASPDCVIVDGVNRPDASCEVRSIIKGDSKSFSIAAASIVAKVSRDKFMIKLAQKHPKYGWEKNVGYGTSMHRSALEKFGVTEHHRSTFKPIKLLSIT